MTRRVEAVLQLAAALLLCAGCGSGRGGKAGYGIMGAAVLPTGPGSREWGYGIQVETVPYSRFTSLSPETVNGLRLGFRSLPFEDGRASSLDVRYSWIWSLGELSMWSVEADIGLGLHWEGGEVGFGPVAGAGLNWHYACASFGGMMIKAKYLAAPVWAREGFPRSHMDGFSVGVLTYIILD